MKQKRTSKIAVMTGATGLLGKAIVERLHDKQYEVYAFSNSVTSIEERKPGFTLIPYPNSDSLDIDLLRQIKKADLVINLAGASLFAKRWTSGYKREIEKSRIETTNFIVELIKQFENQSLVFLSASAIGYYGSDLSSDLRSEAAPPGGDFLAQVCKQWESAANKASRYCNRVVNLRTGIVLSKQGGALPKLALPFRLKVGGKILPGKQWLSWIHLQDYVDAVEYITASEQITGPVNLTAPEPVTYSEVATTFARKFSSLNIFHVPAMILRLLLGEVAETTTKGQRVKPSKLLANKFRFKYKDFSQAISEIY
jgi:hypothetical protein